MKIFRKYKCNECGNQFSHAPLISNLQYLAMCVDPAPSIGAFLKSPVCSKCGSKNIRKEK